MFKKYVLIIVLAGAFVGLFSMQSCKKNKADEWDEKLYEMALETNGFVWFNHSSALLAKSGGSGHSEPYLRTRYNAIAATQLDSNGRILPQAVFPEESLIVKELYDDANTIGRYAILYKQSSNENADAQGWVWGYVDADGTVAESATKKGSSCSSCHSQSGNIDYMLMNKFFP